MLASTAISRRLHMGYLRLYPWVLLKCERKEGEDYSWADEIKD